MYYRNNKLTINLKKITENYNTVCKSLNYNTEVLSVVKANAYGHGIVEVSKALEDSKCPGLCVALVEEGETLRQAGINIPVYILGISPRDSIETAINNNLIITITTAEHIEYIQSVASKLKKIAKIQIAVNTGMNRIGINTKEDLTSLLYKVELSKNIKLVSCFTHLANADEYNLKFDFISEFTSEQLSAFDNITSILPSTVVKGVANSAGIIRINNAKYNNVRAGIIIYGYSPVKSKYKFYPAMEWTSEILIINNVSKNQTIGYGCTYMLEKDSKIAVIAVGYGDGYKRAFSNKAKVIINGEYANVVGRVCMDQIMVDVTNIECKVGDEVVLMGERKNKTVDAEYLASVAETISYEILLSPTQRVAKKYVF